MQERLLKVGEIIGDKKRDIQPLVRVSRSQWWKLVKTGKAPASVKIGGGVFWKFSEIQSWLNQLGSK